MEHSPHFTGKRKAWDPTRRKIMREFYLIQPIPGWEYYTYLPDARMTMIAKAYIQDQKIQQVSYIPAYVNPNSEPPKL